MQVPGIPLHFEGIRAAGNSSGVRLKPGQSRTRQHPAFHVVFLSTWLVEDATELGMELRARMMQRAGDQLVQGPPVPSVSSGDSHEPKS